MTRVPKHTQENFGTPPNLQAVPPIIDYTQSAALLQEVIELANADAQAIEIALHKSQDELFQSELLSQHDAFVRIETEARQQLQNFNVAPQKADSKAKSSLWDSAQFSAIAEPPRETKQLASIMIQGSIMGVIGVTRSLRENPFAEHPVRALAEKLLACTEGVIARMRDYL